MPYALQSDIVSAYGMDFLKRISDRDGDDQPDPGIVDAAIVDADALIDSYVAAKYDLPLATVPTVLVRKSVDIACYYLANTADALTEEIENRYKDALAWLKSLAKGEISLGLEETPPSVGGGPQFSYETRRFTRSKMNGL